MNKVERKKTSKYTTISNVFLRDKNLSLKAKGFLAIVMGLPDDWEFSIKGVCSILKEGKSAVYGVIDELKEHGYCIVSNERNDYGLFTGNDYTFYEEPHTENRDTEEPHTENRDTDNRTQLNTKENKENNRTKDLPKEERIDKSIPKKKADNDVDEFVDRMYALYPTKCPIRGASLGKSYKDKERIQKLLRQYTEDEIESVFKNEIEEKYGKHYMQNFSTFLNNFPDPHAILQSTLLEQKQTNSGTSVIVINGQKYR